jgi:signal transduction histidine kinase
MLAVLAYRHNLHNLLPSSHLGRPIVEQLAQSLTSSSVVSSSLQTDKTVEDSLNMVSEFFQARFVALALISNDRPQLLTITFRDTGEGETPEDTMSTTTRLVLERDDWPVLAQALRDRQQVELASDGPGARQFHEFCQELDIDDTGAFLIEPLVVDSIEIGHLLIAGSSARAAWSEDERVLSAALGPFLAHSLYNVQRYQLAQEGLAPDFEREKAILVADLNQVKKERDQALDQATSTGDQLALTRERLDVEHRRLRETTQALALAAQRQVAVNRLETEVDSLREALSEAELALAYAAASEAGLSTDWVMRTVTRYSGELEEAQAHISDLEERLQLPNGQALLEEAARITGQLRTPLTALGGYTDLLLDIGTGEISSQQESLLRRMRFNVDAMTTTVDSLASSPSLRWRVQTGESPVGIQEALEDAVHAASADLQTKKLRVEMSIADDLPPLWGPADQVMELLANALAAACLVSARNGRVFISASRIAAANMAAKTSMPYSYLRISFSDNAADRSHALYAKAIKEQSPSTSARSNTDVDELGTILSTTSEMAALWGGRSWLDVSPRRGSILYLLLPIPDNEASPGDRSQ